MGTKFIVFSILVLSIVLGGCNFDNDKKESDNKPKKEQHTKKKSNNEDNAKNETNNIEQNQQNDEEVAINNDNNYNNQQVQTNQNEQINQNVNNTKDAQMQKIEEYEAYLRSKPNMTQSEAEHYNELVGDRQLPGDVATRTGHNGVVADQ
ncbi:hypothetical protein [Staphylococcus simiae]|uniref:Lipoprotein n=1 Tax=Staphylococcus simiae CCM 7213 = CCUG 51256 TaxID=911238 RepID=G5JIE8_9STAP|nr:hypothetical protein [Staphylococcus simiae]EHJ08039.1 hypothetical protein SS7213T_06171 [Staphylococcus simiae CCM 7213 = CCUG 51256]PNZ14560.1 hypothetical protein CD113_01760 [Staphylococcus simiae]SNV58071.1 Uncharacterised protein [Staphylococcus simiae]